MRKLSLQMSQVLFYHLSLELRI